MRRPDAQRLFDLAVAVGTAPISVPVMGAIALAIRCADGPPVLYRSIRAGRDGRPFALLKFRTMRAGAAGPAITAATDPRITALGRLLRRSRLDELPQLINVARGEMSIVGPRPEDPRFVALYTAAQREVLRVRPGVTGPTALAFRAESEILAEAASRGSQHLEAAYIRTVMPSKVASDLAYLRSRTLRSDLLVCLRTLAVIAPSRKPGPVIVQGA